jgi:hypothetical protein
MHPQQHEGGSTGQGGERVDLLPQQQWAAAAAGRSSSGISLRITSRSTPPKVAVATPSSTAAQGAAPPISPISAPSTA